MTSTSSKNPCVLHSCTGEMECEMDAIVGPVGIDERSPARLLRQVVIKSGGTTTSGTPSVEDCVAWKRSTTVGLTPFFLKFGKGLEGIPTRRFYTGAFTFGTGCSSANSSLLPYFFTPHAKKGLIWSYIVTSVVLLAFGAVKAHVTGSGLDAKGYMWGVISMLW